MGECDALDRDSTRTRVNDSHRGIMTYGMSDLDSKCSRTLTSESQNVARRRESNSVNPTATGAGKFPTKGIERQLLSPNTWLRPTEPSSRQSDLERVNILLIYILDKGREHSSLHVRGPSGEKNIVRMPVKREDGRPDRLLQEARYPPVILGVKGANSDGSKKGISLSSAHTEPHRLTLLH